MKRLGLVFFLLGVSCAVDNDDFTPIVVIDDDCEFECQVENPPFPDDDGGIPGEHSTGLALDEREFVYVIHQSGGDIIAATNVETQTSRVLLDLQEITGGGEITSMKLSPSRSRVAFISNLGVNPSEYSERVFTNAIWLFDLDAMQLSRLMDPLSMPSQGRNHRLDIEGLDWSWDESRLWFSYTDSDLTAAGPQGGTALSYFDFTTPSIHVGSHPSGCRIQGRPAARPAGGVYVVESFCRGEGDSTHRISWYGDDGSHVVVYRSRYLFVRIGTNFADELWIHEGESLGRLGSTGDLQPVTLENLQPTSGLSVRPHGIVYCALSGGQRFIVQIDLEVSPPERSFWTSAENYLCYPSW